MTQGTERFQGFDHRGFFSLHALDNRLVVGERSGLNATLDRVDFDVQQLAWSLRATVRFRATYVGVVSFFIDGALLSAHARDVSEIVVRAMRQAVVGMVCDGLSEVTLHQERANETPLELSWVPQPARPRHGDARPPVQTIAQTPVPPLLQSVVQSVAQSVAQPPTPAPSPAPSPVSVPTPAHVPARQYGPRTRLVDLSDQEQGDPEP